MERPIEKTVFDSYKSVFNEQAEAVAEAEKVAAAIIAKAKATATAAIDAEKDILNMARSLNMAELHERLSQIPNTRVTSVLDLHPHYHSFARLEDSYYPLSYDFDEHMHEINKETGPMTKEERLQRQQSFLKEGKTSRYMPRIFVDEIDADGNVGEGVQVENSDGRYIGTSVALTGEQKKMFEKNPEFLINPPHDIQIAPLCVYPNEKRLSATICGSVSNVLEKIVAEIVLEMYKENYNRIVQGRGSNNSNNANERATTLRDKDLKGVKPTDKITGGTEQ